MADSETVVLRNGSISVTIDPAKASAEVVTAAGTRFVFAGNPDGDVDISQGASAATLLCERPGARP